MTASTNNTASSTSLADDLAKMQAELDAMKAKMAEKPSFFTRAVNTGSEIGGLAFLFSVVGIAGYHGYKKFKGGTSEETAV